ncbi:MAG: Ig-like domain-containing protein [Prevotellaceae bacterium]|jgi:mannan endo-1,4-beta-mannosidase|nr:Ig-like domain-containing protein [Prevotellaceae bacterium]
MNIKLFPWMLLATLTACGDNDTPTEQAYIPATLLSSTPKGGETIAPETAAVMLTFDQAITNVIRQTITLNGKSVSAASFSGNALTLTPGRLEGSTAYTLTIAPLSVCFEEYGFNKEPYTLSFGTDAYPVPEMDATLSVKNPSQQTQKLYAYLLESYGKQILSGMMANVAWNNDESERVHTLTGKYPAINSYDYIHLNWSPANWIDYGDIAPARTWWEAGGIVAAGWHWTVPPSEGINDPNQYTYEPGKTTFRTANATVEGTWENTVVKADLEKIAGYLKLLRDADIPVLWRPLHEAAGNIYEYASGTAWFWWGNDGAEAYRKLWIYLFDYFEAQGLNNLIWVWTTQTKDNAFYPGDDYVDIIGRDLYGTAAADCGSQYSLIATDYPRKMVTLSECGWSDYTHSRVGLISEEWAAGARWLWFMPWYDNTGAAHAHADDAWWQDAMRCDFVVTRDELPSFNE